MDRFTPIAAPESDLLAASQPGSDRWTPVHRRFAGLAARTPQALAVTSGERRVGYGELAGWSRALARRLRSLGVGPEARVAVCLPRSPDLVASVLAVLEAGGAYVALDPSSPKERLAFQLQDCGAAVLLAARGAVADLGASLGLRCVFPKEEAGGEGPAEPGPDVAPGNLAYVIYTSGSTGMPKGVEISHGSLTALVDWHVRAFGVTAADRGTLLAGVGFDASVWEMWPCLATGAALAVVPDEVRATPAALTAWLAAEGVTVSFLPTPLAEAVLPLRWSRRTALRFLLTGGDRLHLPPPPSVPFTLVNNYGPTEATVVATSGEVPPGARDGLPPIGRPLPHARAVVVDERLLPVPAGTPGELLVGGAGLARGYLGRPDLTAERFVPDPFAQGKAGERLYRTGDLVRVGAGGELEFLGRIDDQVKIRGHRIELGEVEAALARHPGVREGVVTAWDDEDGGKRLVAYVVPDGPAPAVRELRELMLESLPDSMVPSGFVFLESLPYTSSGKVDRRALPEPTLAELAEPTDLPTTPTEARLAELWSEVLRRGAVGVRDSFFELGGHSLLATRILARVADVFGVELPLRALLDAPTVAELAARIDAGSPSERLPLTPLAPEERTGLLPLSFAQEALWFLDRLQPGRPVYNVISRAALQGRLDVAALAGALDALLRRHESLRTRFPEVDGEPRQEVEPAAPASATRPLPVLDLSSLPAERRAAELDRLGRLEARRPFDLAQGPLSRASVVRLGAEDWVVLFAVHHIVFDGWSEGVFWRELSALYAGKYSHPELPELPVQYADFAVWQRRRLAGPLLREQLDGWRERLAGLPPLELPTDRPRPPRQRFRGGLWRWTLPAPLAAAARDLARREGATPFMALLAGFGAALGVYSGQDDFAVGSPLAGRGASGLESLIGYFVNMLTLRLDLSGRPGLRQLLGRVREESLAAFSQPDVPFDLLVQELNPERDLSRNPLFQVAFQVVDEARPLPAFPGIAACSPDLHGGTSKFDLDVELEDRGGAIEGRCEYDLDLFDLATVDRLLGHFNALLAAALAEPDRPLDELSFLSGAERRQLLRWSGAERQPAAPFTPVHRLFEEQARRQPAAPAVGDLTYAELERRATLLALRLREMGVGPEVRTGVCLERSPELVVSVLAVLKAGGAYVALDPSHPAERLAFQLDDSRVPVVVTRLELPNVRRVSPDEEPRTAVSLSGPEPLPENLAYVIYTSGSTGRPKGVELTHVSLLNLVAWHVRAFGLAPPDRSTLVAGVGFDASVWEVWPALSVGASLHVVPEEVRTSPEGVRGWLVEQGITAAFLPTPLAEAVLALEWPGSSLRVLLTGGDRLHRAPSPSIPFVLVNNYGPTEGTVVATSGTVEPAVANAGRVPSIGRPIDGARAFVMDRGMRPVPPGVPGELLVGGAGLARGYVGRPDLTAESFVPDPAGDGGRLYRTGDLVRFLPGGEIDFLGRIDHQVKVLGYRIEIGEIETALARHPEVREAAVLVRDGSLVAYVSGEGEPDLSAFLGRSLPDYMIPAAFVRLPSLPLNTSGKVDRQALARIAPPAPAEAAAFSDPVEELVASLWAEVLGRDVRPGDNFFHLGGHSLLATRVLSRLREAFGVELPLQALFESPTVSGLARAVAAARRGAGAVLPPLRPAPRGGLLPLSFPQQRLWFMDRLSPDSHTYNIPAAFALRGPLDVAALAGAVSGVVDRHEVLRTRFVELDGQPWQEILPAGTSALPFVDLAGLPAEARQRELARIGREEAERPFVLAHGPLLRARLVRLAAEEHVLLLTLHHIASDGWSEAVLDRELSALYEGSPLPELPVQYADFAVWQRSWPEEVLAGQVDWWTRRLTGLANLEVPTDRARPPVQTFRGETIEVAVPPALAEALRDLSRARRSTLFMTLLAAWQALFHRITGQTDVAVGSPVANRNRPEIEGLIGFFVNMLALRTGCGGDPSFGELLERVRGTALEAYDHADVPFERLIDELGLERDLSRQALVQVMFSLHTPPPVPVLRGLETEPLHLYGAVAKFDLTLGLFDHGDRLDGWIEYSTDLFDRGTVARLAGWFLNLLATAAEPGRRLSELELLSPAERHQLLGEWNDTAAPFPERTLMHQFFEAAADRDPQALAAVWEGRELTYAGLEERANRIANLLRERRVERGTPVGVWMERSLDMVAGVLAVLKAGGYYVPLDPAWPADRVEAILRDTAAPAILTRSAHLGRVLEMQWRLPALAAVVCLDVETPEPAPEPVDVESVRAVFDLVSERAVDRVTAGGFVSSLTGLPFSDAEVDEYRDRVLFLAAPWIGRESRVLEIGSGSGLLLWEIAPRVARFVGLDPSPRTQERNRARAAELEVEVELPVGFAHEIEGWAEGSFDLVLIASTAQFFPGPLYLERVVRLAERLLAPGGAVVIADVPDARHPHKVLSVDEAFFLDLGATVHHRETGFDNELRFRYDVVLTRSKERGRSLLTSWHVTQCSAERPAPVAAPEDLAYVIHTSGSTGQPKGIVVQHRPVANLIAWINPAFGLGPSDRVLFVTSLCFDLSVWDVFGVLAAGGCVHVASEDDLQDAERLMRILLEEPVTIWDSAPAALVRLAPLFPSEPAAGSRLRRVMLSGDWIPVTLPDRVRAAFPRAEVASLGGATEATVWSNGYPIGEVDPEWPSIPYGRPMPNAQYHVLDAGLSPCPAGVPGDLYIGGDCLCVGYAHQPDLTAAAFVPDPFGAPGARIYRTGDRARYLPDGNLEFLGRIDHQVKIRGFRIELGEIEVALARHAGVREAVVLAREDVPGDKRLVAYIVPEAGELPDLRDFLRQSLPDYMIPSAFVELGALPVTANGKLDRRALPAPRWDLGGTDESAAPRTPTEKALAALWREILGVGRVGVHDGFFDLGGHSLLATQLVARIREAFRVEMPLRAVFQAPALGEMAAALDAAALATLSPDALEEVRQAFREDAIQPVPRGGLLPLSFQQQRLWLVERLTPGGAAYHIPYAFRLRGALDPAALASALGALAERHEVLRTLFVEREGLPWQEILPPAPFSLPLEELAEEELARAAREEAARPFDLAAEPPFRARLARLDSQDHVLFLTLHHIASDGWSEEILLGELSALHASARLPGLPVQYADYAAWQRAWPEELLAGRLSYWTRQLAGAATLELPADRPRPPVQTFRGASVPVAVPAPVAAALRGLAAECNVTLFMLLLAGWQTLLHRLTGEDDVIVGSPVANRDQPEVRGLVGFFVNLLPLRTDLSGDPTFAELLERVRRTALEAYDHADMPFDRLVDELRLERDLSRHPLFQVLFGLRSGAAARLLLPGVEAERLAPAHEVSKVDLSLGLEDTGEGSLTGTIEYNADLFDRATVERLAGHLANVLAAVACAPAERVSEIPLLTAGELDLLREWSGTPASAASSPALLHEAFAARAAAEPGRPALVWGERRLTYGELDERSDRLAARLRGLGVGPEVRVGLCSARTPDLVIGVLGILKAGGAYVPLDPEYPRERLAFTLEDARVPVLVTQEALLSVLPEHEARVVLLDGPELEIAGVCPPSLATPDNLAYLIYTSGSTGRSKAVAIAHRSAAALVRWAAGVFPAEDLAGVLLSTSICFDLSVFEIFLPLSRGGAVILAANALELPRLPAAGEVTLINTVPSAMAELVRTGGVPSSVRTVNLAGEALPGTLVEEIHGAGAVRVMNLYGPSEDTTYSTFAEIRRGTAMPPIGRPVDGTRAWVLDRRGAPVPPGVPGDLHLGGDGLARGYLGRPDLTADRFVPDALGGEPGARLYRTGDLVRWLPDGNLHFLGRIDHQVKVRGFRIELGELEAALARHPAVREAVAGVRGDALGERTLVAWVVASGEPGSGDLAAGLRAHLRAGLPEYMVPGSFVFLDAMPVTANGKVDRRALPEPGDRAENRGETRGAAPGTPTELALAALWREILGVERIGLHDGFFDLGGHSLRATRLVARIREVFHLELPLRAVFQAPTLGGLAAALDEASVGGAALPVMEVRPAVPEHAIRAVPRGGLLPLSFQQQRLWLVESLTAGGSAYHVPYAFRLRGPLDAAALASALGALAERHEVLRTRFVERGGRPWQEILPPAPVVLAPEAAAAGDLERLAREEAERPFDLAAAPPFRARLLRLGAEDHGLLLTLHHIASDGWSEPILMDELSALYEAAVTRQAAKLPGLPVQYADFAAWQRAWPEELLAGRLAYWTRRLAGLATLELPTDRPRPPVETFRGGHVPVAVPPAVAAPLRALARQRNTTLFMLLLAAWQAVLHRITGQDDVIVGSPMANREQPELRGLIGFFVNMLPLRVDFSADPTFAELLDQVRNVALEGYDHGDVPFERLVDELRLERDLSRHPIFQVLFTLVDAEPRLPRFPGVETSRLAPASEVAKYELGLALADLEEAGFAGEIEYNADLFDRATVERLAGHLGNLLAAVAEDPEARVSEIPLLTAGEMDLLFAWSGTPVPEPRPDLLHEAFAARAAAEPGRPALVWGERRLTYGELDERSDRLAARLRGLGVGPEVRVGLCSARTPDLVIGVLGILKAGGAYVPLDPEYPRERLAFTLEDARVPVLVTQERLLSVLPEHEARILLLDGPEMETPGVPGVRPPSLATPDNLAYLIYTSGSTGRSKGVAIAHRSAVEMVRWAAGVFPAEDLAGVLASTSICFDLSVFEIFLPLSQGGAVILAANALELPRLPAAGEVTLVNTVPSAMAELVRTGGVPASVRTVNLAGEALPGTLVDEIHAHTAAGRVMNLYGPSEDTTYSTFAEIRPGTAAPAIGRPIDGTRAWILDRAGMPSGMPMPPGVPGDLHLAGAGLARGYLERPDLTAERFVPDPWSGEPGGRLYRTGDLVRWLPDGTLHFLGRIDHQVKVRGFRIELGEVEAALTRHPAVREAVVAVRGEALADRHLVAYVTARDEKPAPRDLREFLLSRLPGPAVPSAFVVLDELPRTPNGKVNRRALPALEVETERSAPYAAPSTPVGEALAEIWSDLLGVERVGAHDSFFELGGHSLLASQLVARVRESFGAELPLRAVFQAPTLDALAAEVTAAGQASGPVLRPLAGDRAELPLSASQLRQWFLVQLEPESVDFNLPITVRLEGDLETAALAAALRALARRHESLRATFHAAGGRPVVRIEPGIDLPLPLLDLSSAPEPEREAAVLRAAMADSDRPFDLTRGPLLRALLVRLGEREHLLALTFHHIVFDGFSTAVLLRDLSALYEAEVAGRPADLPALPVQYADYAAWQQEQLRSPGLRAKVERWKERLAGASQVLDLPTDRPRPAVQSLRGDVVTLSVPAAAAAEVRELARREGATLFMTLLAGYASLLSRYTGQEDLNVGTFVANRPLPALERLIGFFVNTLVLRIDLTGNPTFRELLARVREMALEAFDSQEVPFESLLDELETGRDLSRNPLFQAMFALQNFAMPTLAVPGLAFRPVTLSQHLRTNGEIAFWMAEQEDGSLGALLQLSTDLFDPATVARMFRHMQGLLAAGAADPGLRLSELPLLTAGETGQILVEWNRPGEREPEPDQLVHERFERWAGLRPDAVALETADRGEVLTYGELNRRGNRLARRLRRLGVGTDSIVGIWAERGVEFVAGVLGVLKAGGAYMPLDPEMPADRLSAILRGSGISVLLARDGRPAGLPPFGGEVVALRGLSASPSTPEDDRNPAPLAVPGSLAYVLFTSGSTGTPKGVLIPHGALASFAETARRLYGVGPQDRVLQFSSLVFDISVEEIFTSWAAGATLVLRGEEMLSSPARFLRACGELDVQMIDLPTAYWHELGVELARGEAGLPPCVRSVIFAGERALQERLAGWQEAIGRGVRLFNSYGPTEATPASSVFVLAEPAAQPVSGMSTNGLSIGRPMRGARLYVTDFDLQPVPAGVAGELLIAGASLGRGYAGRPDLTAERFVPDPFSRVPGERAYRTGDRVRWLRDGNLEFLGRVDDQVKIRGFRIEPGEIAAAICRHPGVREAVVVPREAGGVAGVGLRLVAYAAAEPGTAAAELRDFVKAALPAYMVPADFVLLDALPLTATGKVDRRALPEPAAAGAGDDGYAPPETVTEELLADIWADLLGRGRVGIFDNFFDLGGHSLLAPQVFARIEETFQVELPLRTLFEAPTVAQLANLVEQELLAQIEELSDDEAESLVEMERT